MYFMKNIPWINTWAKFSGILTWWINIEFAWLKFTSHSIPMDTSSSIRHRFDVEIPRGKFVEMTDFERRIHVEIMTSIRRGNFDVDSTLKSTKYRWVFQVDFSTLFRRWIDLTSVFAVSIVLFPNIFCSGNLF